jgi:hypothetical protein
MTFALFRTMGWFSKRVRALKQILLGCVGLAHLSHQITDPWHTSNLPNRCLGSNPIRPSRMQRSKLQMTRSNHGYPLTAKCLSLISLVFTRWPAAEACSPARCAYALWCSSPRIVGCYAMRGWWWIIGVDSYSDGAVGDPTRSVVQLHSSGERFPWAHSSSRRIKDCWSLHTSSQISLPCSWNPNDIENTGHRRRHLSPCLSRPHGDG